MPITFQIEDETGNQEGSGFDDIQNRLEHALPNDQTPLLNGVDFYGDTVFNRLQCKRLLNEIGTLMSVTSDPEVHPVLNALAGMAQECSSGVHLYLRLIGD